MCVITEQPRGAASSSFNGLPLTRPAAADEYKVRAAPPHPHPHPALASRRSLRALTLTLTRSAPSQNCYDRLDHPQ